MRAVVVTDAVSADNFFPIWHKYYSSLFGYESIHVFTYIENRDAFAPFPIGGLHVVSESYQDDRRLIAMNVFIAEQLQSADVVIRVDVDEFLVADPNKFESLSDCLDGWNGSHITAFGFDLFQVTDEPGLDLSRPILEQRRHAYALTALNKTGITRVPLTWGRGFHYCSLPPIFGDVFLFHLKRADICLQANWNAHMRREAGQDDFVMAYYSWEYDKVSAYHATRSNFPIAEGPKSLIRSSFNNNFLSQIRYDKISGLFNGPYEIESVNVIIPEAFCHFF